jgi:hypothetical protein
MLDGRLAWWRMWQAPSVPTAFWLKEAQIEHPSLQINAHQTAAAKLLSGERR